MPIFTVLLCPAIIDYVIMQAIRLILYIGVCTDGDDDMPKAYNQKIKLLYLMDLLDRQTDTGHTITMKEILSALEANGIQAARKSIYSDIETLRQYGMDIEYRKEQPEGYYLASHSFELAELKLLVDAVQSSRFITEKKSRSLIKKIEGLASRYEASCLQRQVYVSDRIKTMNESIYYNVDKIHAAISENSNIRFQYTQWTIDKTTVLRNEGKFYHISPWALNWTEENYYLIGYDAEKCALRHFRVDKMLKIEIMEERREGEEIFRDFDPARYSRKTFGMFAGKEETVTIRFPNPLIGVALDRFGKSVPIKRDGEDYFTARVQVAVSEQFFGWLTGLGKDVIIVSPEEVAGEHRRLLSEIIDAYSCGT